ncbi:MAG: hypothetical protein ACI8PZ_005954 [Myxococcota bacterium]|jgi:hypothetical protein
MRTVLVVLALISCSKKTAPEAASTHASMQEHYALVTVARDAVVRGDLTLAREAGASLAAQEAPPQPDGWKPLDLEGAAPHHAALRREAQAVADATNLATAGRAVARAAGACGSCHTAEQTGPERLLVNLPPQEWGEDDHMQLHQWASDWMWLGIVSGSDPAWKKGASELAEAPISPRWEFNTDQAGFRELEQLVRLIGSKATEPMTVDEKVALYGDFVGVCAQCHLLLRPPVEQ